MKTINRVRRNGGKTSHTTQVQRDEAKAAKAERARLRAEFALPDDQCHPSCLAIYDRESGEVISKIPLTEDEFGKAIIKSVYKEKSSLVDFIAAAIREKTNQLPMPLNELEQAGRESNALLQLLSDRVQSACAAGSVTDKFAADILTLTRNTAQRLSDAVQAVFAASRRQTVEVAS